MLINYEQLLNNYISKKHHTVDPEIIESIKKKSNNPIIIDKVNDVKLKKTNQWMDIQKQVNNIQSLKIGQDNVSFEDPILNVALEKSANQLMCQTGISEQSARKYLIERLERDYFKRDRFIIRTASSLVMFLKYADAAWILECPECGYEHESKFDVCDKCGKMWE